MVRAALVLALFGSLPLLAETIRLEPQGVICGPIGVGARMIDASDLPVKSQRVRVTLNNLNSKPIVRERVTLHFANETPASGAPFRMEIEVPVGAKQEAVFAESTSVQNPLSYVELNSVIYADGSSWQPSDDVGACKTAPGPLRN